VWGGPHHAPAQQALVQPRTEPLKAPPQPVLGVRSQQVAAAFALTNVSMMISTPSSGFQHLPVAAAETLARGGGCVVEKQGSDSYKECARSAVRVLLVCVGAKSLVVVPAHAAARLFCFLARARPCRWTAMMRIIRRYSPLLTTTRSSCPLPIDKQQLKATALIHIVIQSPITLKQSLVAREAPGARFFLTCPKQYNQPLL
jgi:hypothetical protein